MSSNRKRKSGMRRAYLKKTSHSYDDSPDSALKAAIGLGRNINPINALPHRARLWLDKNKHTPTMTEPMKERVESWRQTIKPQDNEYTLKRETAFNLYEMKFKGFHASAITYFVHLNKISNVTRTSFTYPRHKALMFWENDLKGITWKD